MTPKERELVHQALNHLINLQPIIGNGLLDKRQLEFIDPHIDMAATAIREVLTEESSGTEQPAQQEPVAWVGCGECDCSFSCHEGMAACIRNVAPECNAQQPAQPQQEPVKVGRITDNIKGMVLRQEVMLYTDDYLPIGTALYTSPPAQCETPRKPLTDEQIIEWVESGEYNVITNDWASHIAFARAIEAAHQIGVEK